MRLGRVPDAIGVSTRRKRRHRPNRGADFLEAHDHLRFSVIEDAEILRLQSFHRCSVRARRDDAYLHHPDVRPQNQILVAVQSH